MEKFWIVYPINYGIISRDTYATLEDAAAEAERLQATQPAPEGYAVMEMMKVAVTSNAPVVLTDAVVTARPVAVPVTVAPLPDAPVPPVG